MKQHEAPLENAVLIPRDKIRPNPEQPRREFNAAELKELADSIRAHGIQQPIAVRYDPSRYDATPYIIIFGERRWRASEDVLKTIPCIIQNVDKATAQELALMENIHRKDLSPIEEAHGLRAIMVKKNLTANATPRVVKKSAGWVNNRLALLKTGKDVQAVAVKRPDGMSSLFLIDGVKDKGFRQELLSDVESGAAHSVIKNKIEAHAATERDKRVFSAPDAHTQSRLTAYESNGTPNMSRGKRLVGTSPRQAAQSFEWGLREVSTGISTMENFRDKLPSRKKYLPEIRKQIARLEKLAQ